MVNAKLFTKLDVSSGYWQIKLDEPSSELFTFNTPFGCYKYKRLAFGVVSASEVFSKKISEIIEGLEGVHVAHIQDDIIIWGSDKAQHDDIVKLVLDRIQKSGLKLNKNKCAFGLSEIKYVGHIFSADGVKADPSKIEAITKMPTPNDSSELHRLLGMITYLGKFIPNLSDNTALLRNLLQKDSIWTWTEEHTKQFKQLQDLVTSSPVLHYFDPKLTSKVSVDASKSGLGTVRRHGENWHPIAYTSRSMNSSERNYAQIEKETLAIVFGCERFNEYVYGTTFLVESDHKTLQDIFKRPINQAPSRIQQFLLRMQKYDFTVHYTPGTSLPVADTLSRAYLEQSVKEDRNLDCQVHMIVNSLKINSRK